MPRRAFLVAFGAAAVGFGAARALTTTYVPVLLDRIEDAPGLIGLVMLINAAAGLSVPVLAGVVSDRRRAGRLGRRGGLIAWGAAVAAGGLVAVATSTGTSFLALAAAAAAVYMGLNIATTAHRAVVADAFPYAQRPRATSTQELGALAGGLVGTLAGGALIDGAPAVAFALVAGLVLVTAVPTLRLGLVRTAGGGGGDAAAQATTRRPSGSTRRELAALARLPGAREVLLAQVLWVTSYAAVPTFMILYAEKVLGLGAGPASVVIVAFGALTALGTYAGGRLREEHLEPALLLGVALMGAGALAAIPAGSLAAAALPFAALAFGEGLALALGYPYFTRFVPKDRAGRAAGLFFSVRSIGSALALPVAGGLAELAGYRWIWAPGAAALLALVPLAASRRAVPGRIPAVAAAAPVEDARPAMERIAVVIPYLASDRVGEVARRAAAQPGVAEVVLVDDGAPAPVAAAADAAAAALPSVCSVRPGRHGGKASAVQAGLAALAGREDLDGVMVLDSDAQHPPERIAAFLAAAREADVVIGNRVARRGRMPRIRRLANATASLALSVRLRRRLPDSQNGMRLYRPDVLRRVPLPGGGYDAETAHLRRLLEDGRRLAWVPIPTIYNGEPSGFRTLADSVRVLRAIANPRRRHACDAPAAASAPAARRLEALGTHLALWGPRLAGSVAVGWLVFAVLPVLQPLDNRVFLAINHLGSGPDWLYRAVDPHMRNYALITLLAFVSAAATHRRARFAVGAAAAVFVAGVFSNLVMQVVRLWGNRPRPEEVLGAEAWLVAGREWAQLASFPSGHLVVTSAMVVASVVAVPWLRWILVPYTGVIATTRILFGAHFPSDVVVGAGVGIVAGCFVVGAVRAVGWLPAGAPLALGWRPPPVAGVPAAVPAPAPTPGRPGRWRA